MNYVLFIEVKTWIAQGPKCFNVLRASMCDGKYKKTERKSIKPQIGEAKGSIH